jgi:YEATS domain-containing protein 1/3
LAEAEMEEDESEEEIAEPSSVFSNHSTGSRHSPSRLSLDTKPVFSNSNSRTSPGHHQADSKSVFSNNSSKSSPIGHQADTKLVKKERNRDKDSKKKSKTSGQERNSKGVSNTVGKQTERASLVHSESKGFDVDSKGGDVSDTLYKSGEDIPDCAVESPNNEDLSELVALQGKLMSIKDPNILVQVVMLIQKVGKFQIGDSTFDFDLCSLDSETVQKIRTYLSQT